VRSTVPSQPQNISRGTADYCRSKKCPRFLFQDFFGSLTMSKMSTELQTLFDTSLNPPCLRCQTLGALFFLGRMELERFRKHLFRARPELHLRMIHPEQPRPRQGRMTLESTRQSADHRGSARRAVAVVAVDLRCPPAGSDPRRRLASQPSGPRRDRCWVYLGDRREPFAVLVQRFATVPAQPTT